MKYEVGQNIKISWWSQNAPFACRGDSGMVIDVSGSTGDEPDSYTVVLPEHGTLYLTGDDIKPFQAPELEQNEPLN